jgi:cadmium resistance protein CadD (predicted permease)
MRRGPGKAVAGGATFGNLALQPREQKNDKQEYCRRSEGGGVPGAGFRLRCAGCARVRGGTSMTGSLAGSAGIGALVYASTNLDDLLVLAVFFADPRVHAVAVLAGRFIGLAVLVLVSTVTALLALAIPPEWIALLGLVPLFLGVRLLPDLVRRQQAEAGDDAAAAGEKASARHGFRAQALGVAGVTLANGGDNLGVYIPLFAATPFAIATYVSVFVVMTALWCALGYAVVNNPLMGAHLRRYGHVLLPVVLISLGLYILLGAAPLVL